MGCIQSKTTHLSSPNDAPALPDSDNLISENGGGEGETQENQQKLAAFREFSLIELKKATNGFSSECLVSESGEKAPNVVYRGRLDSIRFVAVKRFSKLSWPDAQKFLALDLIRGKNALVLMDSSLEGQYVNDDAIEMIELALKCLQYEAKDRPDIMFLLSSVHPLQTQKEVASFTVMGLAKSAAVVPTILSPLGKACERMDLTAVLTYCSKLVIEMKRVLKMSSLFKNGHNKFKTC